MKKQVARELGISTRTVRRYTTDGKRNKVIPEKLKKTIRSEVKRCKSKIEVARKFGISYNTVLWVTQDIPFINKTSEKTIEKIRMDVLNGKSKTRIARDLKVSANVVWKYTRDLPASCNYRYRDGNPGVRGKSLEILKILMNQGYYICEQHDIKKYRTLKKYFPQIIRAHLYGKSIIFLENKSDEAIRGFLEYTNKRKISSNELEKISKVFKSKLSKADKRKYARSS